MKLMILDTFTLLDLLMFSVGVVMTLVFVKKKSIPNLLRAFLNVTKVIVGSTLLAMVLFRISMYNLLGTGIDLLLSFLAGILTVAGLFRIETDLI